LQLCVGSLLNGLIILREISFTFWRKTVDVDIDLFCLALDLSCHLGLLSHKFLRLLDLWFVRLLNWLFDNSLLLDIRILLESRFIFLSETVHVNIYIFRLALDLSSLLCLNLLRLRELRLTRLINWLFDSTTDPHCRLVYFSRLWALVAARPVSFRSLYSTFMLSLGFISIQSFLTLNQLALLLSLLSYRFALIKPLVGTLGALPLFLVCVRLETLRKLFVVLKLSILSDLIYC
jgi:hypothetical protein